MGIALLRIVDPDLKSNTLNDFGLAFIVIGSVELMRITFSPVMVVNSQSWLFITITLGFTILITILAIKKGWFKIRLDSNVNEVNRKSG
ncbi:hypothetical protein [Oceanobacillus alkalisoli]|uniref:hypothetical protein n=1 Tax=Oceanobacillus alkalisoli TaxID=2925113 RepID=UPI001EE4CB2F|nr:hypothetical protein [Oceanobacillus alkalisoli]MCG5104205.1 hypothetical protein [Oceanobacillus alkalisoli]